MMLNKGERLFKIKSHTAFGQSGALDHDHRNAQGARRRELGIRLRTAAVFGGQHLDALSAHQSNLVINRKRTAREDECGVARHFMRGRLINAAHEIGMRVGTPESAERQTAHSQKHAPRTRTQGINCRFNIADALPVIALFGAPFRTRENKPRDVKRLAGFRRMTRHLRGERMRRIDHAGDRLAFEIGNQTLNTAKAANAMRDGWTGWRFGATGKREDRIKIGAINQSARDSARLRRATQNQNTLMRHVFTRPQTESPQ